LFIGDVFGEAGVKAAAAFLYRHKGKLEIDIAVANGENSSPRGAGINRAAAAALLGAGVDVITLGNHAFKDRDVFALFKEHDNIIRPANYPDGVPGRGSAVFYSGRGAVGVVNLMGRLYMEACDCPFAAAEREVAKIREVTNMAIVDMHAEATSEKKAVALCVDGRCGLFVGTHTHVQTADSGLLPQGTAFISDAGMTGPADGVIGVRQDAAIRRFRTLLPERFAPAEGRVQFNAVVADIDEATGFAVSIHRISTFGDEEPQLL